MREGRKIEAVAGVAMHARALGSDVANAPYSVEQVYGSSRSYSFRARRKRFDILRPLIERIIVEKGSCRIADLGGTAYYWEIARPFIDEAPVEIHLINLAPDVPKDAFAGRPFVVSQGDVCALQDVDDNAYDLVHSNSVIEHVGSWNNMMQMAQNVRRLAPTYFVQTPYFWFPIEPHFRFPYFHFLPEQIRYRLLMQFNLGFGGRRGTVDAAMQAVQSAALVDETQMKILFPDARIVRERFGPLTKSLMAIREGRGR